MSTRNQATAANAAQALVQVDEFKPDLVVLDVMLPGTDGFELCERLRTQPDLLILMLTARAAIEQKIAGLDAGSIVSSIRSVQPDNTGRVQIALDDFGTGYSSLSYLQRFPFDKIKIDRCFVNDIAEPGGSSCIVQAVVNIAAERKMTTTAEGVETQQQQELLRALGCAEMQGYLFSQAKPAAAIRLMLRSPARNAAAAPKRTGAARGRPG